jgi:tyrosyl-tRNA synthetase
MAKTGLEILKERGFVQQCTDMDSLEKLMEKERVTFYVGVDPTGASLHIGHMVPFFAMHHLQKAGHRPIAVVGGGTSMIGDPSGKSDMRKMLTIEQINRNASSIKEQLGKIIDFGEDKAIMVNNYDWLGNLNYLSFLRDIGIHFSVNRMLSFESYKQRLEKGLNFIEFNYQLLQSYDFLKLNQDYGCKMQMGGDDQWGNIVAGIELIRRVEGPEAEAIGLTFPLVTRADGKKMGKTEKGAVFLDPEMFSPYEFFQYWRNVADADVGKFLKFFTFLEIEEIAELEKLEGSDINRAKERLAYEQTKIIHGKDEADKALEAAKAAFTSAGGAGAMDKDAIPSVEVPVSEIGAGIGVMDLFARTGLCGSRGEARRLVQQGGARVNEVQITDIDAVVGGDSVIDGEILLKAGKKRYFRVTVK